MTCGFVFRRHCCDVGFCVSVRVFMVWVLSVGWFCFGGSDLSGVSLVRFAL